MTQAGASLLIVEDDDRLRERLTRAFSERGLDVRAAATAADATSLAKNEAPELALVDLRIGADNGLELIRLLKAIDPGTRIVVLTGYGSVATAVEALSRGATHYLTKPADVDEILAAFDGPTALSNTDSRDLQPMSLDQVEWEHISRVMVECGGNLSEAARKLGLHRRTLQRKLAKFPAGPQ